MTEVSIVFESPYWIVLIEDYYRGEYSVAREVIGSSEPTGSELSLFFDRLNYDSLRFTHGVMVNKEPGRKVSYKRRIRESRRMQNVGSVLHAYTKAHALLKQQRQVSKKELKVQKEAIKEEKFRLQQIRKKKKHKGH